MTNHSYILLLSANERDCGSCETDQNLVIGGCVETGNSFPIIHDRGQERASLFSRGGGGGAETSQVIPDVTERTK
jgi:hypothetical protein